jgi:processive 1,2-diacylglycerol beta-glucosyltransferase
VLLLTDSLGGYSAPAGRALRKYLTSKPLRMEVREVDFFEEFLPSLAVLARLAYTQDAAFFPGVSGALGQALRVLPENPVLQALGAGALDRLGSFVEAGAFDLILATSPVAAAVAAELPCGSGPPVVSVVCAFSVVGLWSHPGIDLYFVGTSEVRDDLVVAGTPYSRVVVSGVPSVVPVCHESRQSVRRQTGVADRFTVLLGAAGYTAVDVRHIAKVLAEQGIQTVVVPGRDDRDSHRMESLAEANAMVKVRDVGADGTVHLIADVVCARAGGGLLLESICSGVPTVIYNRVASGETASVDFLLNAGSSLLARDEADAIEKVRYLSSHPHRLAQMASAAGLVGSNSAVRLVGDRLAALIR